MYEAITTIAVPMEIICPIDRIVATMAEAMPYIFFSTELMIALVLGDEKKANPVPRRANRVIIAGILVVSSKRVKVNSAKVVNAIPKEAMIRGSILSESLPAIGENKTMTTGWHTKMIPAF